jgi:hypothetical protein
MEYALLQPDGGAVGAFLHDRLDIFIASAERVISAFNKVGPGKRAFGARSERRHEFAHTGGIRKDIARPLNKKHWLWAVRRRGVCRDAGVPGGVQGICKKKRAVRGLYPFRQTLSRPGQRGCYTRGRARAHGFSRGDYGNGGEKRAGVFQCARKGFVEDSVAIWGGFPLRYKGEIKAEAGDFARKECFPDGGKQGVILALRGGAVGEYNNGFRRAFWAVKDCVQGEIAAIGDGNVLHSSVLPQMKI